MQRIIADMTAQANSAPRPAAPGAPAPVAARVVSLTCRFGDQTVLDGIDLSILQGEMTVILGASGCGKSVLLKHLAGLLRPTEGEVWIGDIRIDTASEQALIATRRRLGFLFQLGALFDSMSVGENIAFPLLHHTTLSGNDRADTVAEALDLVGLAGLADQMPADLSGGQQRRVALARAIVLDPDCIFYDEPTTGLDPIRAAAITETILSLQRRRPRASVVVTHDLTSAFALADRMVMLHDGRIWLDGTPECFQTTDDPVVRQFLDACPTTPSDGSEHP